MSFESWWDRQRGDPTEIGLMQFAKITWEAGAALEREACANVCDHEQGTAGDAADKIRMRSNVK